MNPINQSINLTNPNDNRYRSSDRVRYEFSALHFCLNCSPLLSHRAMTVFINARISINQT
jgi:hypothetical protein